jgi:glycine betaine/choline ABC-type transport system substrate-binding protein
MGGIPMRNFRRNAYGAALLALALTLGACGSGVSDDDDDSGDAGGGGTVASLLVLGGPPECPKRPFCIPGLKDTYGVEFKDFQPLDVGGPLTVEALKAEQVDVGLLFSTSSAIVANDFVVLEDDQNLQSAESITPLVSEEVVGDAEPLLNDVSAALTTEGITELNGRVEIDKEKPADVAADFLDQEGISGDGGSCGGDLTVGADGFAESQIVAEMYAKVLEDAGCSVKTEFVDSREIRYPEMKSGGIDVAPDYLSSLLLYLDPKAEASSDPQEALAEVQPLVEKDGLTLLEPSEANDTNAFVVTQETADEFGLATVSDLAAEQ